MSIPVRCTCGSIVGRKEMAYENLLETGMKPSDALDKLKITKLCCRTLFLCCVDLYDQLTQFSRDKEKPSGEKSDSEKQKKIFLKS